MNSAESAKRAPSPDATRARQIVRRVLNPEAGERGDDRSGSDAPARACDDLYRQLSRWVGLDGCHALFARALAEARIEHPKLEEIQLRPRSEPYIEGVTEMVDAYGAAQTLDAIEAMLVHLIELLGRLIGEDMAIKLIEEGLAESALDRGRSSGRRAES